MTEAFKKGYTAKNVPKRRMMVPWADFQSVKFLFEHYFVLVSSSVNWTTLDICGNASTEVMKCLKICEKDLGMKLPDSKHITSYSLRISCCSYLFASNVTTERIKLWIGWAINSAEWFRYVRHVKLCPAVTKLWGSYIS